MSSFFPSRSSTVTLMSLNTISTGLEICIAPGEGTGPGFDCSLATVWGPVLSDARIYDHIVCAGSCQYFVCHITKPI